jgi:hypothetical protein
MKKAVVAEGIGVLHQPRYSSRPLEARKPGLSPSLV